MSGGKHPGWATRARLVVLIGALLLGAPQRPALAGDDPMVSSAVLQKVLADPGATIEGNPRGSVDVVEFLDYRCPYCHQMQATLLRLQAQDRRVRVVFKEWPIFGGVSIYAAQVAIAAGWQGRFAAVHDALWSVQPMNRDSVRAAARAVGVDLGRLDHDLSGRAAEIAAILARSDTEAQVLRLTGTPGLVVGGVVIRGSISLHDLDGVIDETSGPAVD